MGYKFILSQHSSCQKKNTAKCSTYRTGYWKECPDYEKDSCHKLSKAPYVCNGCEKLRNCTLTKCLYSASHSIDIYKKKLHESREGIIISEKEIEHLNKLLVPLIKEKNQSIHHVYINHADEIMMSERTLYKIIDEGILEVRNIDLPRKVRYKKRKKTSTFKVDKKCRIGRTYDDYQEFLKNNPDHSIVQMDTVEGIKGESVILTLHFLFCNFMIAIKRERNDSKSVTDIFNDLYEKLGSETFKKLFPVILTDNGSEFTNPEAIEFDENGERRTYIFYCIPCASNEKGSCEVNHEFIRRVIPKGVTFNPYTQKDINKMMSHINSYARAKLNNKSPYFLFTALYEESIAKILDIECIEPDDVDLSSSLLK